MHELEPSQSYSCRLIGLEAKHGPAPALDSPVILLDDIVQVMTLTHDDVFPPVVLSTQPAQRQMTRSVPIQRDLARPPGRGGRKRLAKESHCRSDSTSCLKQGVDRFALLVDRAVQVARLRSGTTIGLVNAPGRTNTLRPAVPPPLVLRYVLEDPSHGRGVRYVYVALRHQSDEIAITQAVGEIPANAGLDDIAGEPPTSVRVQWVGSRSAPGESREISQLGH